MMALSKAPRVDMPRTVDYSSCGTPWKDRFDSYGHAKSVLRDMGRRARKSKGGARPQAPYQCGCGGWHLADPRRIATYGR